MASAGALRGVASCTAGRAVAAGYMRPGRGTASQTVYVEHGVDVSRVLYVMGAPHKARLPVHTVATTPVKGLQGRKAEGHP